MTINSVIKVLIKTFAGLLIFSLLVVGFFIGINLNDKPPSAAAIEFQQAWDNRAPVAEKDNGYVYLLGFDAEENADPVAIGLERIQWAKDAVKSETKESLEFPQPVYQLQQQLPKVITVLLDSCKQINRDCIDALEQQSAEIAAWQTPEQWFEKRYQTLIKHHAWQELSVLDIRLPVPNYGDVLKAQRLVFIKAFAINDVQHFKTLANQDLHFWRMMLANTDNLIGKMVAGTAIKNNFSWTNLFLLKQEKTTLDAATPELLNQPFTDAELSMYRSLAGEWVFGNTGYVRMDSFSEKPTERFAQQLLLKKQDTSNRIANRLKYLVTQLDVPVTEFESALLLKQQEPPKKLLKPAALYYLLHPYNPVGQILAGVASPAYDGYFARTKDLEVFRLGLLSAIEKRHNPEGNSLKITSPYTKKPFVVDETQKSITVTGYGTGSHGQQVYFY